MWQKARSQIITNPAELAVKLMLPAISVSELTLKALPLRVPRCFIKRMQKGNLTDPLLKQILPSSDEELSADEFIVDPLAEKQSTVVPGVLHKYFGRVLLLVTNQCALNCRFCFRRGSKHSKINWQTALKYIASDPTITEVILSGGDPLMLEDETLARYIKKIAALRHVQYLRIHTRLPLIMPQRVNVNLIRALTQTRLLPVVVVHCNHPQEINDEVRAALFKLKKAGITLLNQSVLLHGINDQPEILIKLSHALFKCGVLPYYLHLLDKVKGAQHFYVAPMRAKRIYAELVKKLSGYLVPKLVKEIVGGYAKKRVG